MGNHFHFISPSDTASKSKLNKNKSELLGLSQNLNNPEFYNSTADYDETTYYFFGTVM